MKNWIEDIIAMMERITQEDIQRQRPLDTMLPGDHFLGALPKSLRNLFVLVKNYEQKIYELADSIQHLSGEEFDAAKNRLMDIADEAAFVRDSFQITLKRIYPNAGTGKAFYIRTGWKIVWNEEEAAKDEDILMSLDDRLQA